MASVAPPAERATSGDYRGAEFDLCTLPDRLANILASADSEVQLARRLVELLTQLTNAQAVVYAQRTSPASLRAAAQAGTHAPQLTGELIAAADRAWRAGSLDVDRTGPQGRAVTLAVPVVLEGKTVAAIAMQLWLPPDHSPESFAVVLQLATGYVALWHAQVACRQHGWDALASAALVELLSTLGGCCTFDAAARALVDHFDRLLHCPAVALAWRGAGGAYRTVALAGHSECAAQGPLGRALGGVVQEAALGRPVDSLAAATTLKELTGAHTVYAEPLRDSAEHTLGVLIICDAAAATELPRRRALLSTAAHTVAEALLAAQLRQPSRPARWFHAARTAPRGRWLWSSALIAALGVSGTWPVTYRVRGTCQVQAATRRFVAAPFAGRVAEALVRPGDRVRAGEPLALMDGEQLRTEMATLSAERARASKTRDSALAAHRVADAEQARLEIEGLDLRGRLLNWNLAQLELVAPLDGVVLAGDLHRATGVPVELGQTLFEIAPLDQLTVEVGVPDADAAAVQPGRRAEVRIDAMASARLTGLVTRVRPAAELREGKNVFVAEVALDHWPVGARPGMQGTARIACDRCSLAWAWLHLPWEHLLGHLGW